MEAAVFSRDSRRLLLSSAHARVWDVSAGRWLTPLLPHYKGSFGTKPEAQFSPDGQLVLTLNYGKEMEILLWNAQTGERVLPPLQVSPHILTALFSTDGRRLLTRAGTTVSQKPDFRVQLWDLTDGKATVLVDGKEERALDARFSADGRRVLTFCGATGAKLENPPWARVWDARTGKPITAVIRQDQNDRETISSKARISRDGQHLLIWGGGTARVYDVSTGKAVSEKMEHEQMIVWADLSPDGSRAVTLYGDKLHGGGIAAKLWAMPTGTSFGLSNGVLKHADSLYSHQLGFSPDGRYVHTISPAGVRIWDAKTGHPACPCCSREVS